MNVLGYLGVLVMLVSWWLCVVIKAATFLLFYLFLKCAVRDDSHILGVLWSMPFLSRPPTPHCACPLQLCIMVKSVAGLEDTQSYYSGNSHLSACPWSAAWGGSQGYARAVGILWGMFSVYPSQPGHVEPLAYDPTFSYISTLMDPRA